MRLKFSLPLTFVMAGILFSALLVVFLNIAPPPSPPTPTLNRTAAAAVPVQTEYEPGLPLRLKIPKLNVDAPIEPVGLTPQGAMGVPSGPTTTAWYSSGPRPGAKGSAAIAGHFGWFHNLPAVFDSLHTLTVGDTVLVEDGKGATMTFIVRELRTYSLNDDAAGVFVTNDGQAHLNLITCQGVWNKAKQGYSKRLVVFTDQAIGG